MTDLSGTTALVTGASRGFGRATAIALHKAGADVVAVARDAERLAALRDEAGGSLVTVTADVTDPVVAGALLDRHRPRTLVLNAGATPLMRPLQHLTWDTFGPNWEVDVKHAFGWVREALLMPLGPGSTVMTMSSGAALMGSPMSGGYAGAKAAIRFLTGYAAGESERAGLGIRFVSVLPGLTPATDLGAMAVAAYAARAGVPVEEHIAKMNPAPGPEEVAAHLTALATSTEHHGAAYLLTAAGFEPLP